MAKSKATKTAATKTAAKKPAGKKTKPKKPADITPLIAAPLTADGTLTDSGSLTDGAVTGDRAIARPVISIPAANASEPGDTDLDVTITTNVVNIRYQLEVTDITGDPPFPAPDVIDIPAQAARVIVVTIPAADLPADHTFQIRVLVNPADAMSGDLDDSINITTDA